MNEESIVELNEIATIYFETQRIDKEEKTKKKEIQENTKKVMDEFEESLGLRPNPTYIHQQTVQTPSDNVEALPCDFGGVKIVSKTNDGISKKRKANPIDSTHIGLLESVGMATDQTISPRIIDFGMKTPVLNKTNPSKASKRKVVNRNVDVLNYIDKANPHLDNLFSKISNLFC